MSELISKIESIEDKYRLQLDEVKKLEAYDFYSDYLLNKSHMLQVFLLRLLF